MSVLDSCKCSTESLAMASFPKQEWCEPFPLDTALANGTLFPCLNLEFFKAEKVPCPACNEAGASPQEKKQFELDTISFAINDLTLYLDTHPDCPKGLNLLKELLQKRLTLLAEYAREYSPLTMISMITGTPDTDTFNWTEGAIPWEGGTI